MTPTPAPENGIQIGQWSLSSAGTVGVGGSGRVSVGVNKKRDVVAIKRMNVSERNGNLLRGRRSAIKKLTLLDSAAKEERIVRLIEVTADNPNAINKAANIWYVLTPFTPKTLHEYKGSLKYVIHSLSRKSLIVLQDGISSKHGGSTFGSPYLPPCQQLDLRRHQTHEYWHPKMAPRTNIDSPSQNRRRSLCTPRHGNNDAWNDRNSGL
jgi:hypothetical protein